MASEPDPDVRGDVRAQIREFLSTRRARVTPQQAGLPVFDTGRRRVPDCAAKRSRCSRASQPSTTSASSGETQPESPRAWLTASCTPSSSMRQSVSTSRPAPRGKHEQGAPAPRQRPSGTSRRPAAHRFDGRRAGVRPQRAPRPPRGQRTRTRAVRTDLRPSSPTHPTPPASPSSTHSPPSSSPIGTRSRTTPWQGCALRPDEILRPRPQRPHRRALHPQRGLPSPLGQPQRPTTRKRPEAHPPPNSRRPRLAFRVPSAARGPGPEPVDLRRRARLPGPGGSRRPGQLDHGYS